MVFNLLSTSRDMLNGGAYRRIVCFGAGWYAERYLDTFPQFTDKIAFFIDNDIQKTSFDCRDKIYQVKSFEVGKAEIKDSDLILITANLRYLTEIIGQLIHGNLPDTVTCYATSILEVNDSLYGSDIDISTVVDFIAECETSGLSAVEFGNSLTGLQEGKHISEQFKTLEETARNIYSDSLKKNDPKLFLLLNNAHNLLCSSVKICDYLFMMNTGDTYHHGCSANSMAVNEMLLKKGSVFSIGYASLVWEPLVYPESIADFASKSFVLKWEHVNKKLVERIKACKHIIFNGETLLDIFSRRSANLYYILYYAKTVLGKKVSVINHSVSPFSFINQWPGNNPEFFTDMLKLLCSVLDNHYVREVISFRELNEFLPGSVKQAFDASSIYTGEIYTYYKNPPQKRDYILISSGNNLPDWYPEFISKFLRSLDSSFTDMPVYYLNSDIPYAYKCDAGLYRKLSDELGNISLLSVKSTEDWLKAIQGAALLVSGRYHHSISAFMLDTPFMSFKTDTRKMAGTLELMKKPNVLLPYDNIENALGYALKLLRSSSFRKPNDPKIKEELLRLAKRNFEFL